MSKLEQVAVETLAICERGSYVAPSGRVVDIADAITEAIDGTELFTPRALAQLSVERGAAPRIEVTDETTQIAAERLVAREHADDLVLLNYASARNPGGGFLGGAKAQEEDLARCSALYPCQLTQRAYYEANRGQSSMLYTDHMIYSPRVPFFRTHGRDAPMEDPFLASVITAPAPNAGEALRRDTEAGSEIRETLFRRARYVIAVAAARKHRTVLLGAWGCGVFRNDPVEVAEAFAVAIAEASLDRVVFAVPRGVEKNHEAFARRFG